MKRFSILSTFLLIALSTCIIVSCKKDDITPEITVSDGTVNYFTKSMDFPASGGSKILNFTSNVSWTLEPSTTQGSTSWCTVSQSSGSAGTYNITVTAAENAGQEDRNTVLMLKAGDSIKTVIVNQKQQDAITLTTDRFEVGAEGGTINVEVKSNINYDVNIPDEYTSWITQSPTTRSMSTNSLSFNIAESTEYDKREGKIIFTSGDITETVTVYQAGSAILILSQNEYTVGSEGGTVSIDLNSNFAFTTDMPNVDWIKDAPKTRAMSSHTLVYEVSANDTYDDREATIVFKDTNSDKKESVTIKQRQKDAILLSNDKVEIGQDGGTFSVDVNSNVDYTISIPSSCSSWLSKTDAPSSAKARRALAKTTPYFKVSASEELSKREGVIYFKNGEISDTLKVYQSGGAVIILGQDTYNIEGGAQTISVNLKSNIDYSVSTSVDWISQFSTRAVSSSTKDFSISSNKTGKSRTGKITFQSSDGTKTATVTINQATLIEAKSLDISFYGTLYAYIGDSYNFFVTCTPSNAATDYEWSSSDTNVLKVTGSGSNATVKIIGYGEANVVVKEKNSGLSKSYSVHSRVSNFAWNSTGETYSLWPMMTIAVGESQKLSYTSDQGSSINNLFGSMSDFVFYEPTYVVEKPSVVSISSDGTVTGLKTGTIGIKPSGYITRASGNNDRIYIKVVSEYSESEYNNDFPYANTIKDGQSMKFSLSSTSDADVFKFNRKANYMYINLQYLGSTNYTNYTKQLRYEVYDSSYSLTGSGTLSFKAEGQTYDPLYRYVGSGSVAYLKLYYNGNYTQNFPDGYFKVSVTTE